MNVGPTVTLAELTLSMAEGDLYKRVQEEPRGSNAGPRVNEYHKTTNALPGSPWCASAACTWIKDAAESLGVEHKLKFSSGALRLLELNPDLIIPEPEVGCLVVWRHDNGKGHVGVCHSWTPYTIETVDGNTDRQGGREGFEVARKIRIRDKSIAGFIRVE